MKIPDELSRAMGYDKNRKCSNIKELLITIRLWLPYVFMVGLIIVGITWAVYCG